MRRMIILIFCSFLFWSCVSVNVSHFNGVERSPTDQIDVYGSFVSIQKKYKEIALITAEGDYSEVDLIEHLKKKAMEIGADAIVLVSSEKNTKHGYLIGYVILTGSERTSKAVAIVYVDE